MVSAPYHFYAKYAYTVPFAKFTLRRYKFEFILLLHTVFLNSLLPSGTICVHHLQPLLFRFVWQLLKVFCHEEGRESSFIYILYGSDKIMPKNITARPIRNVLFKICPSIRIAEYIDRKSELVGYRTNRQSNLNYHCNSMLITRWYYHVFIVYNVFLGSFQSTTTAAIRLRNLHSLHASISIVSGLVRRVLATRRRAHTRAPK